MQFARTLAGVAAEKPEQGSVTSWSNREAVPNSSPIEGLRKPSP